MRARDLRWVRQALERTPQVALALGQVPWADLEAHQPSPATRDDRPYRRQVVYLADGAEIVLVDWSPGARCALHDHGGGCGRIFVLEGAVDECRWPAEAELRAGHPPRCTAFRAGQSFGVDADVIHRMTAAPAEPTRTLHVYWGASGPMRLPDPARRSTVLVAASHGAWRPAPQAILEEQAWPAE